MTTLNLSTYSREQLEHILKMLKSYKNGLKQIGKRAVLIDPKNPPKTRAVIEMHSGLDEKQAEKYAQAVIHTTFPEYSGDTALLRKNDSLKWWARVFVGDDMVDITMQKFESLLK